MKRLFPLLLIWLSPLHSVVAEDLRCLPAQGRNETTLYADLKRAAFAALDRRQEAFEKLDTPEKIHAYQRRKKKFFTRQLGGFPDPAPLEANTVRTIEAEGYRVEIVIFNSQPGHRITANFYLPEGEPPFPAVAVASGHSRTGKTAGYNQRFGIMMAKHGMAALCYDPIGQGERSQILGDDGEPKFSGTTTEHFLVGVGSILVGRNTARYRVWDGMRAIDYLSSRPEIDGGRIGFTGCSGGGTITSYVMALDERVACAVPACYLTTFRHLIETIGPQDAEQNIYAQLAFGMDHPDYVLMRAPRPTFISATTGDFFPIRGTWDNFRQAKRIYARLGHPERVGLVEVEGKHGVHPQNLASIAQWMQRWLLDRDEPVPAMEFATRPADELLCTDKGQVLLLPGEKSVFDLNAAYEAELAKGRARLWKEKSAQAMAAEVRSLIKVPGDKPAVPKWEEVGRVQRDGYHIDKLVLKPDAAVPLPALTFHPPSPHDDAYLYLHDRGKLGDAATGGAIEALVEDGYAVVAVDLRGQGETAERDRDELLGDWKTYYLGYLLEKPLVGLRVEDTLAAAEFIATYKKDKGERRAVHLVGVGQSGIVALHAAALYPDLFASITLKNTPRDWASVVRQPVPEGQLDSTVHGALRLYDLPNLVQLIGEKKVTHAD